MSHDKGPLLELQQQFLRLLMHGDQQIQSRIIGTKKVPVETRLGIYADAYRFRLIDALGDSYPAVHTLLGDDDFIAMANGYIDHHPSQHFSIRWFGHQLSTFLQQTAPYSDSPVLQEMALFEWTLRDVFDAQDFAPLKMDDLQQLPVESWSDLQLEFNPTIQRIELSWNVPALWQAIDQQLDPIDAISYEYPLSWVCWRKTDRRNWFRSMDVDEAWAIDQMRQQADFACICEGLCEWIDAQHAPQRAAGHISRWCEDELITALLPLK